jgi:hypothetical protein
VTKAPRAAPAGSPGAWQTATAVRSGRARTRPASTFPMRAEAQAGMAAQTSASPSSDGRAAGMYPGTLQPSGGLQPAGRAGPRGRRGAPAWRCRRPPSRCTAAPAASASGPSPARAWPWPGCPAAGPPARRWKRVRVGCLYRLWQPSMRLTLARSPSSRSTCASARAPVSANQCRGPRVATASGCRVRCAHAAQLPADLLLRPPMGQLVAVTRGYAFRLCAQDRRGARP